MHLFCGILLKPNEVTRDSNLPGTWRNYTGRRLIKLHYNYYCDKYLNARVALPVVHGLSPKL